MAQTVKNLPEMQQTCVRSLNREDPLELLPTPVFFLSNYFFNWRLITLQYCSVLPYVDMNQPWVYICSPS